MDGRCFLCGVEEGLTREHVPPKGLFPSPRPSDLITVPACEPCNNQFSKDDEYFRLAMAAFIDRSPAGDRIWNEKVERSTVPSKRIAPEIEDILKYSQVIRSSESSGEESVAMMALDPDILHRVVEKIVRGLLYRYRPNLDNSELDFDVTLIEQFRLHETIPVLEKMARVDVGDSVFRFWRAFASHDERHGIWILLFYDACMWSVTHTPTARR